MRMAETSHDPFLPLILAARSTERVDLGTAIAAAFARNPMTLAQTSWDLGLGGRFILGPAAEISAHITRRFSMPWSHPAPRMREMILAIRAIWDCWNTGSKLDFRRLLPAPMTRSSTPAPTPTATPASTWPGWAG